MPSIAFLHCFPIKFPIGLCLIEFRLSKKINVAIHQPALPKYRVPIFARIGAKVNLTVFHGAEKNLTNVDSQEFEHIEVTRRELNLPVIKNLMWVSKQFQLCGDSKWDVVVLPWNTRYLSLLPALIRARINGIGTVLWGHGYSKSSGYFQRLIRNSVTRLATAVLFYDPATCSKFKDLTGRSNCFVAANSLDPTQINEQINEWNRPEKLAAFQNQNRIQGRDVILFVSRFDPNNHLECLIRALPEIQQQHKNVLAVLIGGGPDQQRLESLVKELKCEELILLTGAKYQEKDLAPWFLSSRLFCYPSNIGLSLMHAFNYGLPVLIGNDFGRCNPEIYAFEEGVNGVTFEEANPSSLAEKAVEILCNPTHLSSLSKGAKHTAETVTTIDKFIDGYSEAIQYAAASNEKSVMVSN